MEREESKNAPRFGASMHQPRPPPQRADTSTFARAPSAVCSEHRMPTRACDERAIKFASAAVLFCGIGVGGTANGTRWDGDGVHSTLY